MAELVIATTLGVLQIAVPLMRKMNKKEMLDAESMESWCILLMAFIEDNHGQEGSKMLEEQMKKVRDIAYEIEDFLEEFIFHTPPYFFHGHEISRKVHKNLHQMKHKFPHSGMSDKAKTITKRIENIKKQLKAFQAFPVRSRPKPSSGTQHWVSPLLKDGDMVGYKDEREDLVNFLEDRKRSLMRIAVEGVGGSGKTTLVKEVFLEKEIMEQFECHAWLHMGRHYNVTDLYCDLLKQLGLWNNSLPYGQDSCLRVLRDYVANKRYLVVLDDIWVQTDRDWEYIWEAFPDTHEDSRVIVTMRRVDPSSRNQHIVTLKGLKQDEPWELFCKKAFPDNNGQCSPEFKGLATEICKRCERLPLAIVAVGGSLARKNDLDEWERFRKSFECGSWKDSSNMKLIHEALLPDYLDLDINLKRCFLYFSIFPEDHSIRCGRLIRLWVAEGFAIGKDGRTAEEVADDYLNQLIQRRLVDIADQKFDGRPRNCRVVNLIHFFIVQKCKEENFTSIFNAVKASQSQKIRRMSIHHDHNLDDSLQKDDFSGVRSIFLMRLLGTPPPDFNNHLRKMKLLRVFDFQDVHLTKFPKSITDLLLIKHLSFRGTKIKTIPSSIKKLSYLETLDLKQTEVTELPVEIAHLHNLCHLFVYKYCSKNYEVFDSVTGAKMHKGMKNLKHLQDLTLVKVDQKGELLKELKEFKEMRKLGLMELRRDHGGDLCAAVEEMQNLRTLDVCAISTEEYLELGEMKNPPKTLQRLYLKGRLRGLPTWISSHGNLRRVALKWTKLEADPLEKLKCLPKLVELQLVDCYMGEELIFPASCFRMLKILTIEEMEKLHTVKIEDKSMPYLKELSLLKCRNVKLCPLGIENLKIEKLNLYDMDRVLVARVGKKGEDHDMVKHIPVVSCCALNANGSFEKISDA